MVREFVRYFACSGVALGVDSALYALGLRLGLGYPVDAVVGFLAGLAAAYLLSVRFAFSERSHRDARMEFLIFAAVGIFGLALTEILLWLQIDMMGVSALYAKVGAAGSVFLFNFAARKILLFSRRATSVGASA